MQNCIPFLTLKCSFSCYLCPTSRAQFAILSNWPCKGVRQKPLCTEWCNCTPISSCSLRENRTLTFMRKTPCCVSEKTGFCFKILQCALCWWVLSFPPYPLISSLVIVYLRFEMGEIKFGNSFHSILMNSIRKQKAFVVSSK